MVLLWGLLPILVHEMAHYLVAKACGHSIRFRLSWWKLGRVRLPRWTWAWPQNVSKRQLKIICQAGFLLELGLLPFMPWAYQAVAIVHFAAYPWYAGDMADFDFREV